MVRGGLSNIPCGAGTNHNKNLHKTINPHVKQSQLGIPLPVALVCILLYHNSRKCKSQNTCYSLANITKMVRIIVCISAKRDGVSV